MTSGHHVHWMPLVFAALLALLSSWLNQLAQHPLTQDSAGFTHDPDYIVEHFTVQEFDINGRPKHRLIAERMIHYMDDDSTELIQPHFRQTNDQHPTVDVTARRGLIFGDRESVHFLGDARAVRTASPEQPAFILSGEHLRVLPDAGILSSDKPVILRQGKSVIHAGGLHADEHSKQLELSGGVRGTYE